MSLGLSDPDVMDQLAEGLPLGLRGVKLYPVPAGFDPRSPEHDPLPARGSWCCGTWVPPRHPPVT